jgi:hypothetical protein
MRDGSCHNYPSKAREKIHRRKTEEKITFGGET